MLSCIGNRHSRTHMQALNYHRLNFEKMVGLINVENMKDEQFHTSDFIQMVCVVCVMHWVY